MATFTIKLYDREDNLISDLSGLASQKQRQRWLSGSQVWSFRLPARDSAVSGTAGDGYRKVTTLRRTVRVYRDSTLVANMLIVRCDWKGDKNGAWVHVTCADPMWWWRRRPARDAAGRFALPVFSSPITAPEILQTAVEQTVSADGTLGLDTSTGTFETDGPDLGPFKIDNWPAKLSELATTLADTGVCDIVITPAEGLGLEDGLELMGVLNAYTEAGTDKTATVHFDYGTGDYSLDEVTVVEDAETICNRLYYYLGPKPSNSLRRYQGNITPPADAAQFGSLADSALETVRAASVTDIGQFWDVSVFDDSGAENASRTLFQMLWQTELKLRVAGRTLIQATPSFAAPYKAYADCNPGDVVALNISGGALGYSLTSAAVRLYGDKATIDDNGVERPGQLILSADQE